MGEISQEDLDYIIDEISGEMDGMSNSRRRSLARSYQTFTDWVTAQVYRIGRALGHVISFPFRVIDSLVRGFWEGLTDW